MPEIGQLFPEDGLYDSIYTANKSKETGDQLNCKNQIGNMERKHKAEEQMRETEVTVWESGREVTRVSRDL